MHFLCSQNELSYVCLEIWFWSLFFHFIEKWVGFLSIKSYNGHKLFNWSFSMLFKWKCICTSICKKIQKTDLPFYMPLEKLNKHYFLTLSWQSFNAPFKKEMVVRTFCKVNELILKKGCSNLQTKNKQIE